MYCRGTHYSIHILSTSSSWNYGINSSPPISRYSCATHPRKHLSARDRSKCIGIQYKERTILTAKCHNSLASHCKHCGRTRHVNIRISWPVAVIWSRLEKATELSCI